MNKALAFLFLGLLVSPSTAKWEQISVPTQQNLNSAHFFDDVGFVGADSGILLVSRDEGKNWQTIQLSQPVQLSSVSMPAENLIFATGSENMHEKGWLFSSRDGGNTWSESMINEMGLNFVHFKDSLRGYVGGHELFFQETSDGGVTWTDVEIPGKEALNKYIGFYSIQFPTKSVGYVGAYQKLYKTEDGGLSWIEKLDRLDKSKIYGNTSIPTFSKFLFVSPHRGFFTEPTSYYNSYTGATWSGADSIMGYTVSELNSVAAFFFFDSINGHAVRGKSVGGESEIFSTNDGGRSWSIDTVLEVSGLNDAVTINSQSAIVVGDSGKLFKYTNPALPINRIRKPILKGRVKNKVNSSIYFQKNSEFRDTKGRKGKFLSR